MCENERERERRGEKGEEEEEGRRRKGGREEEGERDHSIQLHKDSSIFSSFIVFQSMIIHCKLLTITLSIDI